MSDSKSPPSWTTATLGDIPRSGIRDFFDVVSQMDDVISLGIGEPGFLTPWRIREAAIFALEHGATSYTSNLGLPRLRRAVSKYVAKAFGADYDPNAEVLITVGVSEALDLAIRALADPGDEFIFHEPCYVSYEPLIRLARATPVRVATTPDNDFRLTRDQLEAVATPRTKALLLNYPTNPTGAVLTAADVSDIAEFAIARDIVVISDEIYSELTYDDERVSLVSLPGMKERTIFLHGMSKAWAMTGFRLGYACAPAELTEAMMKIHQYTMLCAPILSQEAAIEALDDPEADIDGMRAAYRAGRNYIHGALNDMGLACHRPRGAFYAFPSIASTGLTSTEFALRLLREEKVACVPGTAFGPAGEGFIRCSFATDIEDVKVAMERMAGFVGRLRTVT